MSADDAAARQLDEQIDAMLAGSNPSTIDADPALAQVIQLFATDAAQLETQGMPNDRARRRELLERMAQQPRGAASRRAARGAGRAAGLGITGAWRARRVVLVAGCVLALCTTLAFADTRTPAGQAVRTAARTLHLPVPAEPAPAPRRGSDARSDSAATGRASAGDASSGAAADEQDRSGATDAAGDAVVPGEQDGMLPGDGELMSRPPGDMEPGAGANGPGPNAPAPGGQAPAPKPPQGGQNPPPGGQTPPPQNPAPGGQAPPPSGGQQPKPPAGGQQPKPPLPPKQPAGGTPPPNGGQQPKPPQ